MAKVKKIWEMGETVDKLSREVSAAANQAKQLGQEQLHDELRRFQWNTLDAWYEHHITSRLD